jgi:two-component system cell cycle response regulator DivK
MVIAGSERTYDSPSNANSFEMRAFSRLTGDLVGSLVLKLQMKMDNMSNTSKATILYVEDNADNRLLIRRILIAYQYEVLEAANAEQAMEVLKAQKPDLILMDINMPEVDGFTLTSTIKAMPAMKAVPIIALTANVMKGDREKSYAAGCDGYIQKPVDVDDLTTQIRQFLTTAKQNYG